MHLLHLLPLIPNQKGEREVKDVVQDKPQKLLSAFSFD